MATPVIVPKFGMTMEEATILRWFKGEGDRVEKDEPLLEITTEKVDMQVDAPASGFLRRIAAQPGDVVPVTRVIAYIVAAGEEAPSLEAATNAAGETVAAVPTARRLARDAGLDLKTIHGSGPGGRITESDVRVAIARSTPSQAPKGTPMPERRRVIARRMVQSARDIPHVHLLRTVDMMQVASARGAATYTAVIVWAVARALRAHPLMRASLDGDAVIVHEAVHVGVAVDAPSGLVVPVVHDADAKDLTALDREIERLSGRAREDALTLDEVTGATFTVSNLGMFGVDAFTALINPPQSAILSIGAVSQRPRAVGDTVAVRLVCDLVLGLDHRITDGAAGARFLDEVCRRLAAVVS